jgi:hypothetical protein
MGLILSLVDASLRACFTCEYHCYPSLWGLLHELVFEVDTQPGTSKMEAGDAPEWR